MSETTEEQVWGEKNTQKDVCGWEGMAGSRGGGGIKEMLHYFNRRCCINGNAFPET